MASRSLLVLLHPRGQTHLLVEPWRDRAATACRPREHTPAV